MGYTLTKINDNTLLYANEDFGGWLGTHYCIMIKEGKDWYYSKEFTSLSNITWNDLDMRPISKDHVAPFVAKLNKALK